MEPIYIALIGAIGGLFAGAAQAFVGPLATGRLEQQRERRARALDDLNRMADAIRQPTDHLYLRTGAASIGDSDLVAYVGRIVTAPGGSQEQQDAQGDAAHRVGELRRRL